MNALFLLLAHQSEVPKWAPPPGDETAEIRALIDRAGEKLRGKQGVTLVLADPQYDSVRKYPRFRELVAANATDIPVTMVSLAEPGERMDVSFTIKDPVGKPAKGALFYLYHTDNRGAYDKNGVHVQANSGDVKYARLFAYQKTNAGGEVTFHTIRPVGYPNGELPQHFHFHVADARVGEVWFDDDPRLTSRWRADAAGHGAVIVKPTRNKIGIWKVSVPVTTR